MKSAKHWLGILQLIFASVGFGFLGVFGKWAFQSGMPIGQLLTLRFLFASIVLWSLCILIKPSLILLDLKQIIISALLGFCGYAVFSSLYFTAIRGVSISLAALLLYTYPFWVSILNQLFKIEKMRSIDWLLLLGASSGLTVFMWGDLRANSAAAVLAGLGSALTYAIYIIVSSRWQKNVNPLSSSLYVILFASIGLYLFHHPNVQSFTQISRSQFLIILGVATIGTVLPLTLVLAGLQKMKSSEAALITMLEPITASIAAWCIFSETLGSRQLVGACMVGTCLALSIFKKS